VCRATTETASRGHHLLFFEWNEARAPWICQVARLPYSYWSALQKGLKNYWKANWEWGGGRKSLSFFITSLEDTKPLIIRRKVTAREVGSFIRKRKGKKATAKDAKCPSNGQGYANASAQHIDWFYATGICLCPSYVVWVYAAAQPPYLSRSLMTDYCQVESELEDVTKRSHFPRVKENLISHSASRK
jgi:hypothetical protein